MIKAINILTSIALVVATTACHAAQAPQSSPLDALTRQAEERYKKSSADKRDEKKAEEPKPAPPTPKKEERGWSLLDTLGYKNGLTLGKTKEFSDDWWNILFERCEGAQKREEPIECEKIVEDNPLWKEVGDMAPAAKRLVMKRALKEMRDPKMGICRVACAVCVGADPNERAEPAYEGDSTPHTALHLASPDIQSHFGLWKLLLEKGARPMERCAPAHPWSFASGKFREELIKHGGKPPVDDNDDD